MRGEECCWRGRDGIRSASCFSTSAITVLPQVTVLVAPHIVETIDQSPRVVVGRQMTLACPVLGNPTPAVRSLLDLAETVNDEIWLFRWNGS